MTSKNIENPISYIVDANGEATDMVISLKNKNLRAWAKKLKENIEDWQAAYHQENKENAEYVDMQEMLDRILAE